MGLIGGMARTAVIVGTATAVGNRVSRRQANRWAEKDQSAYAAASVRAAAVRAAAVRAAAVRPARNMRSRSTPSPNMRSRSTRRLSLLPCSTPSRHRRRSLRRRPVPTSTTN